MKFSRSGRGVMEAVGLFGLQIYTRPCLPPRARAWRRDHDKVDGQRVGDHCRTGRPRIKLERRKCWRGLYQLLALSEKSAARHAKNFGRAGAQDHPVRADFVNLGNLLDQLKDSCG